MEKKVNLKNSNLWRALPVILWVALVIFAVGAILLLAIAVPHADATYKRVLSVICAILMLLLAILIFAYQWLSRDSYPNFFLYDRKKKKNIPVDKLTFTMVSARIGTVFEQLTPNSEELWTSDILLHENDKFGYKSAYKPLVVYKMLYDLATLSADSGYWKFYDKMPKENFEAMCVALKRAGDGKLAETLTVLNGMHDNAKMKSFLQQNLPYLRKRMVQYCQKNIEYFY